MGHRRLPDDLDRQRLPDDLGRLHLQDDLGHRRLGDLGHLRQQDDPDPDDPFPD